MAERASHPNQSRIDALCAEIAERKAAESPFEPTADQEGRRCHADTDGDCIWEHCPQLALYRVGCPLADWGDPDMRF